MPTKEGLTYGNTQEDHEEEDDEPPRQQERHRPLVQR